MNRHRPPGAGDDAPWARLSDLDDEELLAALREVITEAGPPPQWSIDLAKDSFAMRMADAELAALMDDSELVGAAPGTRGDAPRLAVFDCDAMSVEVELSPGLRTGSWQLLGQLLPPAAARVRVRRKDGDRSWVTADELGRFMIDQVPAGPLSLVIEIEGRRPIITDWISVS